MIQFNTELIFNRKINIMKTPFNVLLSDKNVKIHKMEIIGLNQSENKLHFIIKLTRIKNW